MTDWRIVEGSQTERPEEVDKTSSPSIVYLRRNIEQAERESEGIDGKTQTQSIWQYEERELTKEEYENMKLIEQIVANQTSGIVETVTEFQKESVIDEYTTQLIEEGLL